MAIPYHTHRFTIPQASKADVKDGTRTDVALVPASVGSAASYDETAFATAEQGAKADTALQPGDIGSDITGPIGQFVDNGFPNHQTDKYYNQGSYVRYITGSGTRIYRSKVGNNTDLPTNTSSWEPIGDIAFRDKINVEDINASGNPNNQTFLRGDGSWSESTSLVYGPDSFVTSPSEAFPSSGSNVVYAMNGSDANPNPDSTFWYELGNMASKEKVDVDDIKIDGSGPTQGVSNAVATDGSGNLYWYVLGDLGSKNKVSLGDINYDGSGPTELRPFALCSDSTMNLFFQKLGTIYDIDKNNNPNQFLNGQGNWDNINQGSNGQWFGFDNVTPYEDDFIRVQIVSNNYQIYYKQSGSGVNISTNDIFNVTPTGSGAPDSINGCVCLHFFDQGHHYTIMGRGVFVQTSNAVVNMLNT